MSGKADLDLLFDLGVALPGPVLVETSPGVIESFSSRRAARKTIKKRIEDIAAARPKYIPPPPYTCLCGTRFDTFEELYAHGFLPHTRRQILHEPPNTEGRGFDR